MSSGSLPSPPSWASQSVSSGSLVYPESSNAFTNVLLIDRSTVSDAELVYRSANASTFPIIYAPESSSQELLALLGSKFASISRIGLCFAISTGAANLFLNSASFFDEVNVQFVVGLLNQFAVANIDYLACSSLVSAEWSAYYAQIMSQTSARVGASNDKTGNIKYGGDWVMESTGQDVEAVYFTEEIKNYQFLLDTYYRGYGCITSGGVLYGMGSMSLGLYKYATAIPNLPVGKTPVNMSCDNNYVIVLMSDGTLYGTGPRNNGVFGLPLTSVTLTTFTQLPVLPSNRVCKSVLNVVGSVIVLTTDGYVYTIGATGTQFGNPNSAYYGGGSTSSWFNVSLPTGKTAAFINHSGQNLTVVMTDGTLYGYGNMVGQSSLPAGGGSGLPINVSIPDGKLAKYAVVSGSVIGVLTTDGLFYMWYSGTQTSLTNIPIPSGLPGILLRHINGGIYILDSANNLYAIGQNIYPYISNNMTTLTMLPSWPAPGKRIVNIDGFTGGAESTTVYALTADGLIYGSGINNNYQLCQGNGNISTQNGWIQIKTDASTYLTGVARLTSALDVVASVTPPTLGAVTVGDGSLSIAFTAPSNGLTILRYEYALLGGAYTTMSPYSTASSTSSPISIIGLANDVSYTVYIRAVYSIGSSSSVTATGTPVGTTLGTPVITAAVPGNGSVSLSYVLNGTNGAGYSFLYSSNSGSDVAIAAANPLVISGLTNGSSYTISIKVVNGSAVSAASNASASFIPGALPEAPVITSVVTTNKTAAINFTDGNYYNAAVLGYKYSRDNGVTYKWSPDMSTPLIAYDVSAGTPYQFKMRAVTTYGTSPDSNVYKISGASNEVDASTYDIPAAPVITSIIPGNGCAYVYFSEIVNHGNAVSLIQYSVGSGAFLDASGVSSPITVPGLTNGGMVSGKIVTPYSIRITATNAAGVSPISNSMTIIPGAPTPPVITSLTAGNQSIIIAFTTPTSDNGSAITGYTLTYPGLAAPLKLTGLTSPITVPKLVNGTVYNPRLIAVNKNGSSPASNSLGTIFPYTLPASPKITAVTSGYQSIQVAFTAGASNGAAITKYRYNLSIDPATTWYDASGLTSPITITGTPVNTDITVKLVAVNLAGECAAPAVSKSTKYIFTVPAQIKAPVAIAAYQTLSVPIIAPASVGSSITKYSYALSANAGAYSSYVDFSGVTSPFTIAISNNVDYNIQVTATNAAGTSIPSLAMAKTVKYIYLPPAVGPVFNASQISVSGNTVSGSALLTFAAPAIRGASITSYMYMVDSSAGTPINLGTTVSPVTISGLSNNSAHTLYMYAVTPAGNSPITACKPFTIVYDVPAAPKLGTIAATATSLSIPYTASVANGSVVSSYSLSVNGGAFNDFGLANPISLTGLTTHTNYTIILKANNAVGASAGSTAVKMTA